MLCLDGIFNPPITSKQNVELKNQTAIKFAITKHIKLGRHSYFLYTSKIWVACHTRGVTSVALTIYLCDQKVLDENIHAEIALALNILKAF